MSEVTLRIELRSYPLGPLFTHQYLALVRTWEDTAGTHTAIVASFHGLATQGGCSKSVEFGSHGGWLEFKPLCLQI